MAGDGFDFFYFKVETDKGGFIGMAEAPDSSTAIQMLVAAVRLQSNGSVEVRSLTRRKLGAELGQGMSVLLPRKEGDGYQPVDDFAARAIADWAKGIGVMPTTRVLGGKDVWEMFGRSGDFTIAKAMMDALNR